MVRLKQLGVPVTSITYYVDATNSSNPKLMRQASGGTTDELAEQVIGFQVGAGTATPLCVSGSNTTDVPYSFNPANYCYNWTDIQSVRVSIVGRTNPSQPVPNFQNSFDQGPYKIEALTVIVSPRNLRPELRRPEWGTNSLFLEHWLGSALRPTSSMMPSLSQGKDWARRGGDSGETSMAWP